MVFGRTFIVSTGQDLSLFISTCGTAVGTLPFIVEIEKGSVPFFHIQRQVICAVVEFDLNLRD